MLQFGLKKTSIAFVITVVLIGIPAAAMLGIGGAVAAIVLGALPLSVLWGGFKAREYSANQGVAESWRQLANDKGWECSTDEVQRPRLSGAVGDRQCRARIERHSGGNNRFGSHKTHIEAQFGSDAARSLELVGMPAVLARGDDFESRFAVADDSADDAGIESAAARGTLMELIREYDGVVVTDGRLKVTVGERVDDTRLLSSIIEHTVEAAAMVDEAMSGQTASGAR